MRRQEGCPNNHAPNNNTPVKTGVLWGCIEGVEDDPNGYGQVVFHLEITSSRSSTVYGFCQLEITRSRSSTST